MIYALGTKGNRIEALPDTIAACPLCGGKCIPKCGEIKIWHWAHKTTEECDTWHEPESEWHRAWKLRVLPENREVTIGRHRADMIGTDGTVIELQRSSISIGDVAERERFYDKMIWIFDLSDCIDHINFRARMGYYSFRWRHARAYVTHTTKPSYWDMGDGRLFACRKISSESPVGGWGQWTTIERFANGMLATDRLPLLFTAQSQSRGRTP